LVWNCWEVFLKGETPNGDVPWDVQSYLKSLQGDFDISGCCYTLRHSKHGSSAGKKPLYGR
jgi:hypothetical protein